MCISLSLYIYIYIHIYIHTFAARIDRSILKNDPDPWANCRNGASYVHDMYTCIHVTCNM